MVDPLSGIRVVFLDMDGVLYKGDEWIKGSVEAVRKLKERVERVFFTTNNSAFSRKSYAKKLRRVGIEVKESEVITSAFATAVYLKKFPGVKALVVGGRGLEEELRAAGIEMVDLRKPEKATHVVAGIDKNLSYEKIAAAAKAISSGADFIATNLDALYPVECGFLPGAGATVGAISGCTGKKPSIVIGKPSPFMLRLGMRASKASSGETAVIGDRLDTDVKAAKKLNLRSILVLTGVTKAEDLEEAKSKGMSPDFVFRSLSEVVG